MSGSQSLCARLTQLCVLFHSTPTGITPETQVELRGFLS